MAALPAVIVSDGTGVAHFNNLTNLCSERIPEGPSSRLDPPHAALHLASAQDPAAASSADLAEPNSGGSVPAAQQVL